jgi:hypothetical protein
MKTATPNSNVASERRSVAARRAASHLSRFLIAWLIAVGVLALPLQAERKELSKAEAEAILKDLKLPFPPTPDSPAEAIASGEFFALTEIRLASGEVLKSGEEFQKLKASFLSSGATGDSLILKSPNGNGYRFSCSNLADIGKAEIAQGLGIYQWLTMERTPDGNWDRIWMNLVGSNLVQFKRNSDPDPVASCGSSGSGPEANRRKTVRLSGSMRAPLREHILRTCSSLSSIPFEDLKNAVKLAESRNGGADAGRWIEAELVRNQSGSWELAATAEPRR